MKFGLSGRDAATLAVGMMLGWGASRTVIPVPQLILLSPRVQCGGIHEVGVPMVENAAWAVQSGKQWWSEADKRWGSAPQWRTAPGEVLVGPAPDGVRIAARGLRSGNVAGSFIRAVKVPEEKPAEKPDEKKGGKS